MIVSHLHDVADLLPLLRPGIHAGRIVGAGVQHNDALLWDFLQHEMSTWSIKDHFYLMMISEFRLCYFPSHFDKP